MDKGLSFGPELTPQEEEELDALFSKDELTEAEQKRFEELLGGGLMDEGPDVDALLQTLSGDRRRDGSRRQAELASTATMAKARCRGAGKAR